MTTSSLPSRWRRLPPIGVAVAWALAAFAMYAWFARVSRIGWSAVELIIGQHLLRDHVFALSVDYPSAIAWRPVLPTTLIALGEWLTPDPVLLLRMFAALAIGVLTGSMYLAAHRAFGARAAMFAAAGTLLCPAVTFTLLDHVHSVSHFGALLVLGPAFVISVGLFRRMDEPAGITPGAGALAGLSWGLCYLARAELLLFAALLFGMLTFAVIRSTAPRGRPMFALAAFVLGFAVCFVPYNVHAARVTARDGTLIRKPIYGFYISQGWVDPRPNAYPDTEADGYLYAISLYGSPESNHESLIEAIGRHPGTAWRRVRLNFSAFYARFLSGEFFPAIWTLFAALGVIFAWARGTRTERRVAPFLLGCFGCTHFILIFHIDPRYLTIGVPPLLLLAAFGADRVVTLSGKPWRSRIVATAVIAVLAWAAHGQIERWRNCNPTDLRGVVAMRSLGEHFRHVVPRPTLAVNREPHIEFVSSANVPLPGEDAFLLAYFSHTAWVGLGADGPFPRGKFYAYRASPADYRYVPADELKQHPVSEGTVIDEYENPVLGRYALVKLSGRK